MDMTAEVCKILQSKLSQTMHIYQLRPQQQKHFSADNNIPLYSYKQAYMYNTDCNNIPVALQYNDK